ncbi:MAG: cysteine desulfurase-like protein [Actinomycetota bacterium]|nr:cysteine desulfurase-like protein [Actinomycetota bacterium]
MAYDVDSIRSHFPALKTGAAFFDTPGGSQVPDTVATTICDTLVAGISNRGRESAAARMADDVVVAARAAMADLLGSDADGIVFGRSMTQLTYDFARTIAKTWSPGDEVMVTRLDHDANIRPWVQAAETVGATVRWADFDPATGELTADDIAQQLSDSTRLVAVTGASNLIGTRPPLAEIAALVHQCGALLAVDGVHLTPHFPIDVAAIGADLFACSPYKFLGPHCGVMAGRPNLLAELRPDKLLPATDSVPEKFELGTLSYELLAGSAAAVDFIASISPADAGSRRQRIVAAMSAVAAHEGQLQLRIERALAELPGVVVHSRAGLRTPTLLLTFVDHDAAELSRALAGRNINAPVGSFYALEASRRLGLHDSGGMRIGLAPYTNAEDVDRLLDGLREALAA